MDSDEIMRLLASEPWVVENIFNWADAEPQTNDYCETRRLLAKHVVEIMSAAAGDPRHLSEMGERLEKYLIHIHPQPSEGAK